MIRTVVFHGVRRGVTLIVRPSPVVGREIKRFLDEVAAICPGQYFYQPDEMHVTLISLVSGTVAWRPEMRRLAAYRAVVREVLASRRAFKIRFQGVTASPAAVMIQGFPEADALNQMREAIRTAFSAAGLGQTLDRRYKINTAHITAARFQNPAANWQKLVTYLEANRTTPFGECAVEQVQLIWGDWYASAGTTRLLETFALNSAGY